LPEVPNQVVGREVQEDVHSLKTCRLRQGVEVQWRDAERVDERQIQSAGWNASGKAIDLVVAVTLEHLHPSVALQPLS
jgi:hypothetical protein